MTKKLIIKDLQTNKYYTDEYDNWWSFDIQRANQYSQGLHEDIILNTINELAIDDSRKIEQYQHYQLITIYIK